MGVLNNATTILLKHVCIGTEELHWKWHQHMCTHACWHLQGLLAYWLQGSTSAEGDRKVNLIVTRDTPLWDGLTTLQQAAARGPAAAAAAGSVLPPADSLDNIALAPAVGHPPAAAARQQVPAGQQQRRRAGADSEDDEYDDEEEDNLQVVIAQAAKLFPRFMMPPGPGGAGGGGGGLLEAGEGHGPRKEFFLLLGTNASSTSQVREWMDARGMCVFVHMLDVIQISSCIGRGFSMTQISSCLWLDCYG